MTRTPRSILVVLAALALAMIFGPGASAARPVGELTIVVSIDGFRADYLDRVTAPAAVAGQPSGISLTPNLTALAADGVRAVMHPSYPTLTFPNHYAIVTGLRPDHNGIVDNNMEDPRRPGVIFGMGKKGVADDPFWWDEAEPIWVTAERAGVRTATMFWPGSDVAIRGGRPRDWRVYDRTIPADQRVDQVLAWLGRPADQRPRLITLYFEDVDTAGHAFGPDSPELNAALARVDAAVGRLVAGLKAQGLYAETNLVIVSDHGMAATAPDRVTYLDSLLPSDSFRAVTFGGASGIAPSPGHEAEVAGVLLSEQPHMTCWAKASMPARLHYGSNRRIPPIICLGQTGWMISTRAIVAAHPIQKGAHGFDPDDPMMDALFVAEGPAFKKGAIQPPFDNVDVYPLVARLIGVAPRANDGHLADLAPSLDIF